MAKGKSSGITLWNDDVKVTLGMVARGDREHDIAAWFGVNQGRIAEAKAGSHGQLTPTPANQLPPSGPPGVKGRRLRSALNNIGEVLQAGDGAKALELLTAAVAKYDTNEG